MLPRPSRALLWGVPIGAALVACVGFSIFVSVKLSLPELAFSLAIGTFALLFLGWLFWGVVGGELATTRVHITRQRMVVKTKEWGREQVQSYPLNESSCVKQYWGTENQQLHDPAGRPSGLVVVSDHDASGQMPCGFGDVLSRGELDWVEWRINRFLGRATDADAPAGVLASLAAETVMIEGLPDEPLPAPQGMRVRIDEGGFETRIHFPHTAAMGTYRGKGMTIVGMGVFIGCLYSIVCPRDPRDGFPETPPLFVSIVVGLFGLLTMFAGLIRIFGGTLLTISPERITCRTTLLGLLPFYWKTLRTADVISVGSSEMLRSPSGRMMGPSEGLVIRTANKGICLADDFRDTIRNAAEADWLQGEIALRIRAARTGMQMPPLWNRRPARSVKPTTAIRQLPKGPVPYNLHQRPLPSGNRLNALLPIRVGSFQRKTFDEPDCVVSESYEAEYRSDQEKITITVSLCDDSARAQESVAVAQAEVAAGENNPEACCSLNTEPSFFRVVEPRGALLAWSRGKYFFSASVRRKNGEETLDRFMNAFPY